MLILSRKAGESILLHLRDGRTVDVKVVEIPTKQRVRLGIAAPSDVVVVRNELEQDGKELRVFTTEASDG